MLISRNQTDITAASSRDKFDRCFRGAAPAILLSFCHLWNSYHENGFNNVLRIKHDLQIAYDKNYELGFRHSYTDLWERFGGVSVGGRIYLFDIPPKLRPLALVNPTHRRRALYSHRIWHEIAQSACSAFGPQSSPGSLNNCPDDRSMSVTLAEDRRRATAGAGINPMEVAFMHLIRRCLKPRKTRNWFALSQDRPFFAFAGLWTPWRGVRGPKSAPVDGQHELFGFLTTEPNAVVAPIHPKAMPVILTAPAEVDLWLLADARKALELQRPRQTICFESSQAARRRMARARMARLAGIKTQCSRFNALRRFQP